MRKSILVLLAALAVGIFVCSYSPEPALALGQIDEIFIATAVDDESPYCLEQAWVSRYWRCQALQCWAEYVVGGCTLSTENSQGQSKGDKEFEWLFDAFPDEDFQALPAHVQMTDESAVRNGLEKTRAPWYEVCGPVCHHERWAEEAHQSFLGCQLRLEACGQKYSSWSYFPGYSFDHCRRDGQLGDPRAFCSQQKRSK